MKASDIAGIATAGIAVVIIVGILASFPRPAPASPPHVHDWDKWSTSDFKSDEWAGTRYYQQRVCKTCGLVDAVIVRPRNP